MRLLWLENQPDENAEYLDEIERWGGVTHAGNVAEALLILRERPIDGAVIDMKVPLGLDQSVDHLADLDYNGAHVIDFIEQELPELLPRTICLTNFERVSKALAQGVVVLSKGEFLSAARTRFADIFGGCES